ncbi:MAG: hypothetical protein ACJ8E3_02725 [Sphingomicrobium sp.]
MNVYEFVIAIVFVTGIFSIIRARMGVRHRGMACGTNEDSEETLRLRDEVKTLKERIHVLERITVEKENSLSREIEALRDR